MTTANIPGWVAPLLTRMQQLVRHGQIGTGEDPWLFWIDVLKFAFQMLLADDAPNRISPIGGVPLGNEVSNLSGQPITLTSSPEVVRPNDAILFHVDRIIGLEDERPIQSEFSALADLLRSNLSQ